MSHNAYEDIADAVSAIKSDTALKAAFNQILSYGTHHQQVRVTLLLEELQKLGAPDELKRFVRSLSNDQLAHQILKAINDEI